MAAGRDEEDQMWLVSGHTIQVRVTHELDTEKQKVTSTAQIIKAKISLTITVTIKFLCC